MLIDFEPRARQFRDLLFLPETASDAARDVTLEMLDGQRMEKFEPAFEFFLEALGIDNFASLQDREYGLVMACAGLGELLECLFAVEQLLPDEELEWLEAFRKFHSAFKDRARRNNLPENGIVEKRNNVLGFYLVGVRRDILRKSHGDADTKRKRWRNVCLAGFRGTALALEQTTEDLSRAPIHEQEKHLGRLKGSSRAIALALEFLPVAVASKVLVKVEEASLRLSFELVKESKALEDATAENYLRRATAYLNEEWYDFQDRSGGGIRGPGSRREKGDRGKGDWWDRIDDEFTKDKDIEEGGCEDEWGVPPEIRRKSGRTPGTVAFSRQFVPPGLTPLWSGRYVTAEAFGVILASLIGKSETLFVESENLTVFSLLFSLLCFGFEPGMALRIQSGTQADVSGDRIIFDGEGFWIWPKTESGESICGTAKTDPSVCEVASPFFRMPVSPALKTAIQLIQSYQPALNQSWGESPSIGPEIFTVPRTIRHSQAGEDIHLPKIPITEPMVDNTIFSMCFQLESRKQFLVDRKPVRFRRLARTATALLQHIGGLTEMETALIRGRVPRHLVAAFHYSNFEIENLIEKHQVAVERVLNHVVEQSSTAIRSLNILPDERYLADKLTLNVADAPDPGALDAVEVGEGWISLADIEGLDELPAEDELSLPSFFGSPFVPRPDAFRSFLEKLFMSISDSSADWRIRYNRAVVYGALACLALTGVRPAELQHLTPFRVDWQGRTMKWGVEAKRNRHYSEWRVVRLPDVARKWVGFIEAALGANLERIRARYPNRNVDSFAESRRSSVFCLMTRRGLLRRVTPATLAEWFRDPEENVAGEFPWRINATRHFFRTTALRMGEPKEMIDALLGHMTRGREALGLFATVPVGPIAETGERISRRIETVLGIRPPEWDRSWLEPHFPIQVGESTAASSREKAER